MWRCSRPLRRWERWATRGAATYSFVPGEECLLFGSAPVALLLSIAPGSAEDLWSFVVVASRDDGELVVLG
jgi:hypothetical protein